METLAKDKLAYYKNPKITDKKFYNIGPSVQCLSVQKQKHFFEKAINGHSCKFYNTGALFTLHFHHNLQIGLIGSIVT